MFLPKLSGQPFCNLAIQLTHDLKHGSPRRNWDNFTRLPITQLGIAILLKTFQRLGYFVRSNEIPEIIIQHIATSINRRVDRKGLLDYDQSKVRYNHLVVIKQFLSVVSFSTQGKALLQTTLHEAALTKRPYQHQHRNFSTLSLRVTRL